MPSRDAAPGRADGHLGRALLLRRRGRARSRAKAGSRATRGSTPTRTCGRSSTRSAGGSGGEYRVLVDENDHVDREGAARAGVGFYGKNTMLITRRHGSWVVLGTLVTDVEVERSQPLELDCGACTLCIEACPTGALDEPGVLDSTRCLSYWTQAPGPIPEEYREPLGAQVYGCDICQDVCPWNRGIEKRRAGDAAAGARGTARLARRVARARRRRAAGALRAALLPAEGPTLPAPKRTGRAWKLRRPRTPARGRGATPTTSDPLLREHAEWALARLDERDPE